MNDIARQLRAQIPFSTDPDRLERMAREAESRARRGDGAGTEPRATTRTSEADVTT